MSANEKLLDIDYLKSFGVDPHYFGLGFIQLKIEEHGRVHFYHNDLPVLAEEPHNHRYNFISHVLQGNFYQTIWQFNSGDGEYFKSAESCTAGVEAPYHVVRGEVKEILEIEHLAGSYYRIDADTFHTVRATDNCITYLVRDKPFKQFPDIIIKEGADKVCPFSQPIPVSECWEMIEDMLPGISKPGYHMTDIPKGTIGEPTKILEEALELLDAHNQGVKIMQQVELSDLYGSIIRYMEKHHPDLTMDEVRKMHEVTRRAFDNGRRD